MKGTRVSRLLGGLVRAAREQLGSPRVIDPVWPKQAATPDP